MRARSPECYYTLNSRSSASGFFSAVPPKSFKGRQSAFNGFPALAADGRCQPVSHAPGSHTVASELSLYVCAVCVVPSLLFYVRACSSLHLSASVSLPGRMCQVAVHTLMMPFMCPYEFLTSCMHAAYMEPLHQAGISVLTHYLYSPTSSHVYRIVKL